MLGDRCYARSVADDAFVQVFGRLLGRRSRAALFATALRLADERSAGGRVSAGERATTGWLNRSVAALPQSARRCVLLHHAGLDVNEIARALHVSGPSVVAVLRCIGPDGSVRCELGDQLGTRAYVQLE
jgi:hypothetical protein